MVQRVEYMEPEHECVLFVLFMEEREIPEQGCVKLPVPCCSHSVAPQVAERILRRSCKRRGVEPLGSARI